MNARVLKRQKFPGLSLLNVSLVAIVLAIAVTAYLLFFRGDSEAATTARPSVAVARGDVTASVTSSGTLQSGQTASPQFETSGTVTAILIKVGQVVAKGAAIAKVDPAAAERAVRIAQQNQIAAANSVTAAEETLSDAEDAAEEAEEAAASPTPTPTEGQQTQTQTQSQGQSQSPEVVVTNAKASLARAKADKEQADQNLEGAQADVDATTLKAPIAGTITAINGAVGNVVAPAAVRAPARAPKDQPVLRAAARPVPPRRPRPAPASSTSPTSRPCRWSRPSPKPTRSRSRPSSPPPSS